MGESCSSDLPDPGNDEVSTAEPLQLEAAIQDGCEGLSARVLERLGKLEKDLARVDVVLQ